MPQSAPLRWTNGVWCFGGIDIMICTWSGIECPLYPTLHLQHQWPKYLPEAAARLLLRQLSPTPWDKHDVVIALHFLCFRLLSCPPSCSFRLLSGSRLRVSAMDTFTHLFVKIQPAPRQSRGSPYSNTLANTPIGSALASIDHHISFEEFLFYNRARATLKMVFRCNAILNMRQQYLPSSKRYKSLGLWKRKQARFLYKY